jgi:pyrimidine operon attenuation protein/uracil phosphoribosyltransferase
MANILLDKENPAESAVVIEPMPSGLQNKVVIICDDVLYTGRTFAYAAVPFLKAAVKKLECLVLISRNHLSFPIYPAYIGMSLATTLKEHVRVSLQNDLKVILE